MELGGAMRVGRASSGAVRALAKSIPQTERLVSSGARALVQQSSDEVLLGVVDKAGVKLYRAGGPGSGCPSGHVDLVSQGLVPEGARHGGEDAGSREKAYQMVKEFASRFEQRHGTLGCKELMGCDISTPEGMQAMKDRGVRSGICTSLVRDAAEILEVML